VRALRDIRLQVDTGKLAPAAALLLLVGSICLGLVFVLAIGFGYLPALGGRSLSLDAFRTLADDPRTLPALGTTLLAGTLATLAATSAAFALVALVDPCGAGQQGWPQRMAVAVLAVPHVAMALGLGFVLAPSGWLMRGLDAVTGLLPLPPDVEMVPREQGLTLALGLFLKETPFLFVAMATALRQIGPAQHMLVARALGYSDGMAWMKLVLPRLYPLVRFPILAVLAYGLSVVDMSLILGPTTPVTLPVLILKWTNDPDLAQRFLAGAAALLQVSLVAAAILTWWLGERAVVRVARGWLSRGGRRWPRIVSVPFAATLRGVGIASVALTFLSLGALLLWSLAQSWRYPSLFPDAFSLSGWQRSLAGLWSPLATSLLLAVIATTLSLVLALACLEHERRLSKSVVRAAEKWLFLPLLVPEVSFLLGLQILLLLIGCNGSWAAVLWMHLLFVFPYVFLTLKDPWRSFDPRYERAGVSLGKSPWTVFRQIKLPLLRGPLAWAAAVGCAISLSLYLPTVQGGEGRIATLASEAVSLSAGGDRRVVGVYGILQAVAAGLFFILAVRIARPRHWRAP
jgi:putative thiamine transport system permease protein